METIELLYKEYSRIHSVIDSYAASSFSDFKMLGAVGLMMAWEPFANRLTGAKINDTHSSKVVFLGFVAIFFIIAIIASRDLMKQSIIAFEISQIGYYEAAIRQHASLEGFGVFDMATPWKAWAKEVHGPISMSFRLIVITLSVGFPVFVLRERSKKFSNYYLLIATIVLCIYLYSVYLLING